jgi:hypothetical protein
LTTRLKRLLPYLALTAVIVGFLNFFWFMGESTALGGDGLNGYTRDGKFFLGSHGTYTEVSEAVWTWSRLHGASVLITHPLLLAGMFYLLIRHVFPAMMVGRSPQTANVDRAAQIRSSGPLISSARTAGQIGEVQFSGPLLTVSVYPGGVVVKPAFMDEHAIRASDIRAVETKRRVFGQRVEISHAGADARSPFIIFGSADSPLIHSIEKVASDARSQEGDLSQARETGAAGDARGSAPEARRAVAARAAVRLMGPVASVVMIGVGIVWAIPSFGTAGLIWTGFAVFIAVTNLRRYLTAR